MMAGAVARIEALLKMEEGQPAKDDAGVYIPLNLDAAIRAKALRQCLQIIEEERRKRPCIKTFGHFLRR